MRVLALDYGSKRIGLALGDTNLRIALPFKSLKNTQKVFWEISSILQEKGIDLILVGLPLTPSGKEGQRAEEVREFVEKLKAHLPEHVEVLLWDERYTTEEALRLLDGQSLKKKRELKDCLSAYIILTEYLDTL